MPTVDDKLGLLKYKIDDRSHIKIASQDVCRSCQDKPCTTICPAQVYTWHDEKRETHVQFENCIECGACRMLCPLDNVKCDWPRGGFGVAYRFG